MVKMDAPGSTSHEIGTVRHLLSLVQLAFSGYCNRESELNEKHPAEKLSGAFKSIKTDRNLA